MDDEFAKIQWLSARFRASEDGPSAVTRVEVGIGDDAAVVNFGAGPTVVTVDTHVEGVHFRRDWLSSRALGARAVIAAASDVWAMCASPHAMVVALTLPAGESDEAFRELIDGIEEGARASDACVVGGNLSDSTILTLTTTVLGTPSAAPIRRNGATVGDRVYVTGPLGSAGVGLAALLAGEASPALAPFIGRWRRPPTHQAIAATLATAATAAIDVSDGCLQDLSHLCEASSVGAMVRAEDLPVDPGYAQACKTLGLDPLSVALTAGEDYEIVFCAPPDVTPPTKATPIGVITEGEGVQVVDADGGAIEVDRRGYRHFS